MSACIAWRAVPIGDFCDYLLDGVMNLSILNLFRVLSRLQIAICEFCMLTQVLAECLFDLMEKKVGQ